MATPETVAAHISHLSRKFPGVDDQAEVLLLVGADCGEAIDAHQVIWGTPSICSPDWAMVGPVCPKRHRSTPRILKSMSILACADEHVSAKIVHEKVRPSFPPSSNPFLATVDDHMPWPSREDRLFVEIRSQG